MPDIDLWRRVWNERKINLDWNSTKTIDGQTAKQWSKNLCYFLKKHPGIVDLETFREFTHVNSLPVIAENVAIGLMNQEHSLCQEKDIVHTNTSMLNNDNGNDNLNCFQTRCIEVIYKNSEKGDWQFSNTSNLGQEELWKLLSMVLENMLFQAIQFIPKAVVTSMESVNGIYKMRGWKEDSMFFT